MLQLFEEVENISLDRHIQSGDALICNHKFWPRCQCPSNGNPLSLPARKSVGVAPQVFEVNPAFTCNFPHAHVGFFACFGEAEHL